MAEAPRLAEARVVCRRASARFVLAKQRIDDQQEVGHAQHAVIISDVQEILGVFCQQLGHLLGLGLRQDLVAHCGEMRVAKSAKACRCVLPTLHQGNNLFDVHEHKCTHVRIAHPNCVLLVHDSVADVFML
eukprot:15452147-Alexandrium_andersonii.AAC.1